MLNKNLQAGLQFYTDKLATVAKINTAMIKSGMKPIDIIAAFIGVDNYYIGNVYTSDDIQNILSTFPSDLSVPDFGNVVTSYADEAPQTNYQFSFSLGQNASMTPQILLTVTVTTKNTDDSVNTQAYSVKLDAVNVTLAGLKPFMKLQVVE